MSAIRKLAINGMEDIKAISSKSTWPGTPSDLPLAREACAADISTMLNATSYKNQLVPANILKAGRAP
jgi:hypothetical protein